MPKYRVLEKSYINMQVVEEGAVVDYDPPPGTTVSENLELIEEAPAPKQTKAEKAAAAAAAANAVADATGGAGLV